MTKVVLRVMVLIGMTAMVRMRVTEMITILILFISIKTNAFSNSQTAGNSNNAPNSQTTHEVLTDVRRRRK